MNTLIDNGFLPEEHFSKKGSTTDNAKVDKTLREDLSRQARYQTAVVSVDAAQRYDRKKTHLIMTLVLYAIIRKMGPIAVLITCLQTMRFFQRTDVGDSTTFLKRGKTCKAPHGIEKRQHGSHPPPRPGYN